MDLLVCWTENSFIRALDSDARFLAHVKYVIKWVKVYLVKSTQVSPVLARTVLTNTRTTVNTIVHIIWTVNSAKISYIYFLPLITGSLIKT